MNDHLDHDPERRVADAMASFGRDHRPREDGWREVEAGTLTLASESPAVPWRTRRVVGIAAALFVGVVTAGAVLLSSGADGPGGTDARADLPSTTEAPASTTLATSIDLQWCLDALDVEYDVSEGAGGPTLTSPATATAQEREAFTEGVAACEERERPTEGEREGARDYMDDLRSCMEADGFDPQITESAVGGYDIVAGAGDAQEAFDVALTECISVTEGG